MRVKFIRVEGKKSHQKITRHIFGKHSILIFSLLLPVPVQCLEQDVGFSIEYVSSSLSNLAYLPNLDMNSKLCLGERSDL